MADSLDEMDGRAAVEGVAQPVGGHRLREAGVLGRDLDDAMHLRRIQRAALARSKNRRLRIITVQRHQLLPDRDPEQHSPRFAALAEQGDLAGIVAGGEVTAAQRAEFADAQSAQVKQPRQRLVAGITLKRQQVQDRVYGENFFREHLQLS